MPLPPTATLPGDQSTRLAIGAAALAAGAQTAYQPSAGGYPAVGMAQFVATGNIDQSFRIVVEATYDGTNWDPVETANSAGNATDPVFVPAQGQAMRAYLQNTSGAPGGSGYLSVGITQHSAGTGLGSDGSTPPPAGSGLRGWERATAERLGATSSPAAGTANKQLADILTQLGFTVNDLNAIFNELAAAAYDLSNFAGAKYGPVWLATLLKVLRAGEADGSGTNRSAFYDGTNSAISRLTDLHNDLGAGGTIAGDLVSINSNLVSILGDVAQQAYDTSGTFNGTKLLTVWLATLVKLVRGGITDATANNQSALYDGTYSAVSAIVETLRRIGDTTGPAAGSVNAQLATLNTDLTVGPVPTKPYGTPFTGTHRPAVSTTATVTIAAVVGKQNVCTGLYASLTRKVVGAGADIYTVSVRNGTTGVGTILWTADFWDDNTVQQVQLALGGLWIVGSTNTAMTLEFEFPAGPNTFEVVSLVGITI